MTEEAREYLVTQYRNLRQSDASGSNNLIQVLEDHRIESQFVN
jgi:hypothetical protein